MNEVEKEEKRDALLQDAKNKMQAKYPFASADITAARMAAFLSAQVLVELRDMRNTINKIASELEK